MDGGAGPLYNPRTVEAVFRDYKGRRAGLIKALTTDVVEFYQQCDPEKENLCLYAYPGGSWEVTLPAEEVPPELPEPALGINFARDGMLEKDWLSLVAVHSDAWLLSVSFYFAARFGFGRSERKRLFTLINDLPTIFEAVTGSVKKQETEKPSVHKSGSKVRGSEPENEEEEEEEEEEQEEEQEQEQEEEDEEEEDDEVLDEDEEQGECAACGESYVSASEEFWICCDVCEKWYHGKCVKITPARADHIKHYKCPACNNKRSRP